MIINTRDGIACVYVVVWGRGVGVSLLSCKDGHCVKGKASVSAVSGTTALHSGFDPHWWPTGGVTIVPLCWRSDVAVDSGLSCCVRPFCGSWHECGGGGKCS